jgi:hypothetical protein
MDGFPVDVDEWKAELRITDPKAVTAGWPDENIPGTWHCMFVWYPLSQPLPDPEQKLSRAGGERG